MSRKAPQNTPAPAPVAAAPEAVQTQESPAEAQTLPAAEDTPAAQEAAPEAQPAAETVAAAEPEKTQDSEPAQEAEPAAQDLVLVRAVHGDMLNLFTNQLITSEPKKYELDAFIRGQIAAGKLEVVTE